MAHNVGLTRGKVRAEFNDLCDGSYTTDDSLLDLLIDDLYHPDPKTFFARLEERVHSSNDIRNKNDILSKIDKVRSKFLPGSSSPAFIQQNPVSFKSSFSVSVAKRPNQDHYTNYTFSGFVHPQHPQRHPHYDAYIDTLERARKMESHPKAECVKSISEKVDSKKRYKTEVIVENMSTLQAVQKYQLETNKTLTLVMANATTEGGHPPKAGAQEEKTFRSSNGALPLLTPQFRDPSFKKNDVYDSRITENFDKGGGIYVKDALYIKDDEGNLLRKPVRTSFFLSAAFDCNKNHTKRLDQGVRGYDRPNDERVYKKLTEQKIVTMLRKAAQEGYDTLILGAFGCGAFKNDPKFIASLYKEILEREEFKGAFRRVVFAIIDGHGSQNFSTFKDALSTPSLATPVSREGELYQNGLHSRSRRSIDEPEEKQFLYSTAASPIKDVEPARATGLHSRSRRSIDELEEKQPLPLTTASPIKGAEPARALKNEDKDEILEEAPLIQRNQAPPQPQGFLARIWSSILSAISSVIRVIFFWR